MRIQRRNDLSLRLLEIFGTLMMHQTTVDTATELGISQPAVSLAIKELEKQLGFALFERVKRRLHPTGEARSLFVEIEPLLAMIRSVESHVRDLRDGTEGKLRLMATPPLGNRIIPSALKRFLSQRPNVAVNYNVGLLDDVIDAVESGSAEIGLVLGLDHHPAVHVRVLQNYRFGVLVPPMHPLASATHIGVADAAQHGFIGLDRRSRLGTLLESAFTSAGVAHEPRVIVRHCLTAAMLADAGIGMAIVDPFTMSFVSNLDLVSIPFDASATFPASLLTRSDMPLSRIGAAFMDEFVELLGGSDVDPSGEPATLPGPALEEAASSSP